MSEYQLDKDEELATVYQILDSISASADIEESSGFDPSGSSGPAAVGNAPDHSGSSARESPSETDFTSMSQSVGALSLGGLDDETATQSAEYLEREAQTNEHIARLQPLTTESKESILIDAFPGLKEFDIKWTLKKHNNDIESAMEDLLFQTFQEETGGRHRGVEGFSEGGPGQKKKKQKHKNKKIRLQEASESCNASSELSMPVASAWKIKQEGVELISKLSGRDQAKAAALYNNYKGNIPAALNSILAEYDGVQIDYSLEALEELTALVQSFPKVELDKLGLILAVCQNADSSPAEFCHALVSRSPVTTPAPPPTIKLNYALKPKDGDDWNEVPKRASMGQGTAISGVSCADASLGYRSLRNENFEKASAAYRKSRSDPLMSGAAAYYSQEGRDYNVKAKSATSAHADVLVAQQSSSKQLDLHGVTVNDAVRIAREAVTAWWHKVDHSGTHGGYTIITGKGTHSEDGVARIRNAVGRMLIREGWKVDINRGSILVRGTTGIKKAYR